MAVNEFSENCREPVPPWLFLAVLYIADGRAHLLHPLKFSINTLQSSLQGLLNNREKR